MSEPQIIINGVELTDAMVMTVRSAINSFAIDLTHKGLGADLHGKAMTEAYLARIREINSLIFKET